MSQSLGPFDDVDKPEAMESYLDDSNMRYLDYISAWTLQESKELPEDGVLPLTAVVHSVINWKAGRWSVFHNYLVAPEIANRSGELEDYQFFLSVLDLGI